MKSTGGGEENITKKQIIDTGAFVVGQSLNEWQLGNYFRTPQRFK